MTCFIKAFRGLFSASIVIGMVAIAPAIAEEPALPRYKLKVGQELKYHGTSEMKQNAGTQPSYGSISDWQVWVVRANADGSWRLILRSSSQFVQNGKASDARVNLAFADLFPDGRIVPNDSIGLMVDPSSILPRLPKNADEAKAGWAEENKVQGTRTEFKPAAAQSTANEWDFEAIPHKIWDKIYLSSQSVKYAFDIKRGMVKRLESEYTQGYGITGKGNGTEELVSLSEQSPDQIKTLAAESDRYFTANKAYEDRLREGEEAAVAQAEKSLKDAEALTHPLFRDRIDEQLKSHAQMKSYYLDEAKNRAALLGKPAAEWEIKDLEGKPHSLKGYRGKVVVLDFWYRGCGWCIRAMPQLKELAGDFKDQPVAILGMNTDRNDADAKLVIEEMGLNYPTLKAEGVPEKYNVRGFPTLIIIDQEGKVADIHVGYSPTLRESVSKSVKKLLAGK